MYTFDASLRSVQEGRCSEGEGSSCSGAGEVLVPVATLDRRIADATVSTHFVAAAVCVRETLFVLYTDVTGTS